VRRVFDNSSYVMGAAADALGRLPQHTPLPPARKRSGGALLNGRALVGNCFTCTSPERVTIEALVKQGMPYRQIARKLPGAAVSERNIRDHIAQGHAGFVVPKRSTSRKQTGLLDPDRGRNRGLAPEQWDALVLAQEGRCAICSAPLIVVHTDHCHATGVVRGLLCHGCNIGLGNFQDDPDRMRSAITYLENAQALLGSTR
jgi:hypothetical protein